MLDAGYEITMADVRLALEKQGMKDFKFAEGDAIAFYTGWSKLWKKDNAKFNSGEPGFGMEVARWMAETVKARRHDRRHLGGRGRAESGSRPARSACTPTCRRGTGSFIQENAKLDELVADRVWVFTYIYSPAPIVGATGSIGAPIAID
jgi:kynurenine formamidase